MNIRPGLLLLRRTGRSYSSRRWLGYALIILVGLLALIANAFWLRGIFPR